LRCGRPNGQERRRDNEADSRSRGTQLDKRVAFGHKLQLVVHVGQLFFDHFEIAVMPVRSCGTDGANGSSAEIRKRPSLESLLVKELSRRSNELGMFAGGSIGLWHGVSELDNELVIGQLPTTPQHGDGDKLRSSVPWQHGTK
jgi:hypothetical protein